MILVAEDEPVNGAPHERIPKNDKRVVIFPGVNIRQVAQILEFSENKSPTPVPGASLR